MSFQTYSSRYNFFVKWQNVQLCMQINFITKFLIYFPWFSRNNSISGATSLKALRKESLVVSSYKLNLFSIFSTYISYMFVRVQRPFGNLLQDVDSKFEVFIDLRKMSSFRLRVLVQFEFESNSSQFRYLESINIDTIKFYKKLVTKVTP